MKITRNMKAVIKEGSLIHSHNDKPGDRVVGKNYAVTIVEFWEDKIYWVGRHGNYCYTDLANCSIR